MIYMQKLLSGRLLQLAAPPADYQLCLDLGGATSKHDEMFDVVALVHRLAPALQPMCGRERRIGIIDQFELIGEVHVLGAIFVLQVAATAEASNVVHSSHGRVFRVKQKQRSGLSTQHIIAIHRRSLQCDFVWCAVGDVDPLHGMAHFEVTKEFALGTEERAPGEGALDGRVLAVALVAVLFCKFHNIVTSVFAEFAVHLK